MGMVSIAALLKSSTVVWLLGLSSPTLKEHRDLSLPVICHPTYDYGYKSCDDLHHYAAPIDPDDSQARAEFIGKHPFLYAALYGNSLEKVDKHRLQTAEELYTALDCASTFSHDAEQYKSLKQADLLAFLNDDVAKRIAHEEADLAIDAKRAKSCAKSRKKNLRG